LTDDDASERLEAIQEGMTAAITSVRDVIFDLAPPHLGGGLIEATTLLCKRLFGDTDTVATVSGSEPDLVPRDSQLVYRIVAEALRNVRRHAHASSVEVDFDCRPSEIVVSVRDDGLGFPDDGPEQRPGHLGLRTMNERAQALGGSCSLTHRPGGGTVVAVRIAGAVPRT
jgi:signal transduction histidine kinase